MIETIAISTGTSPATSAPKTSTRTMSAAGRPNASSPVSRSLCDCLPKSWFDRAVAGDAHLEAVAVRVLHHLLDLPCARVALDADEAERGMVVGRLGDLVKREHLPGLPEIVLELLGERLELR